MQSHRVHRVYYVTYANIFMYYTVELITRNDGRLGNINRKCQRGGDRNRITHIRARIVI